MLYACVHCGRAASSAAGPSNAGPTAPPPLQALSTPTDGSAARCETNNNTGCKGIDEGRPGRAAATTTRCPCRAGGSSAPRHAPYPPPPGGGSCGERLPAAARPLAVGVLKHKLAPAGACRCVLACFFGVRVGGGVVVRHPSTPTLGPNPGERQASRPCYAHRPLHPVSPERFVDEIHFCAQHMH